MSLSPVGSPVTPQLHPPAKDAALHLLCLAAETDCASPPPHYTIPPPPPLTYPVYVPQYAPPALSPMLAHPYMYPLPYSPPLSHLVPVPYAIPSSPSLPPHDPPFAHPPSPPRKVKGPWRPEEDKILTELVSRLGARRWTVIASHIPGRTGKQARERWLNQLSPDLEKRPWTVEEDRIVMQAHARLGNRWSEIAKLLKGRTDNATKNRFNTTIRRQISELACQARRDTPAKDCVPNCSPVTSQGSDAHGACVGKRNRDIDDAQQLIPLAQRRKTLIASS